MKLVDQKNDILYFKYLYPYGLFETRLNYIGIIQDSRNYLRLLLPDLLKYV